MIDQSRLLFIHGLMGNSQGFKATLLRRLFPAMVIPDFPGEFPERMAKLREIIGDHTGWTLIGSSMGGLMAVTFVLTQPETPHPPDTLYPPDADRVAHPPSAMSVRKLVLLAPALPWLPEEIVRPLDVPAVIYHGRHDVVVPLDRTRELAERLFPTLSFHEVDDDHGLGATVQRIDWVALLDD